jgi:hypothetical protein
LTSSVFNYWLKGTIATASLARMFQSTPGLGTCGQSAVSRTSFFVLCNGDVEVGMETLYYRGSLRANLARLELCPGS